ASRSVITLPPQSCEISSTNVCPNPVEPRGFGAAMTQPCAAHSSGFHRYDHASSHAPCGPPWIRNTTGYFLDASKLPGLMSQYCTDAPAAPVTVRLSGVANATSCNQASCAFVRAFNPSPFTPARNRSAGLVRLPFASTTKSRPTSNAAAAAPLVTTPAVRQGERG